MTNQRRTRNYFPEPRFQLRFLRLLLVGALIQMGATSAILHHFVSENYELLVRYAALDSEVEALLQRELKMLIVLVGGTFFVYFVALAILGVAFSHRVAGVIVALKRTMGDIADGKQTRLRFRKGDEFQDVQDAFNRMVDNLEARAKAS